MSCPSIAQDSQSAVPTDDRCRLSITEHITRSGEQKVSKQRREHASVKRKRERWRASPENFKKLLQERVRNSRERARIVNKRAKDRNACKFRE